MRTCDECGTQNSDNALYCGSCGNSLSSIEESTGGNVPINDEETANEIKISVKRKSKKIPIIIVSVMLFIILLGIGGYFGYTVLFQSQIDKLNANEKKIFNALIEKNNNENIKVYSCSKIHEYGEDGSKDGEDSDGLYPTFVLDSDRFNEYCYAELKIDGDKGIYLIVLDGSAFGMTVTYDVMAAVVGKALDLDGLSYSQLALGFEKLGYDRWYVNPCDDIDAEKINDALEEYYQSKKSEKD